MKKDYTAAAEWSHHSIRWIVGVVQRSTRNLPTRSLKNTLCDMERSLPRYVKIVLLLVLLCVVFMYHAAFIFVANEMDSIKMYKDLRLEMNDPQQTCQIPMYHPFEKDVLHYFKSPRPVSCRSRIPKLTFIDKDGYLLYNSTAFTEAGYSIPSLKCVYQEIYRIKGNDRKIRYGEEKTMTGKDKPSSDFIYVACRRYSWLPNIYSMYHAFAQRRPTVRNFNDDTEVGVAVVGLDSVSRLNFMRQLPRTYQFIADDLSGIILKGFNKVGENTFPNLIAMLTGNQPLSQWPKSTFDNWPFIWNTVGGDNVATFYGEDCSSIMTFAWWGEGFDSDPTTHYFRPFWLAVDSSTLAAWSSPMCLSSVPKHQIYLDYLKSFLRSYNQRPVFMFSLENEPCHDYLNTVGVIDNDLKQFLSTSYDEGLFNRTILFVLSDHGHRFDDFRKTRQGKIEDRMPMVSVILPPWFSQMYPHILDALKINSRRLTSSFDLYSTFVDIFQRQTALAGNVEYTDDIQKWRYVFQKPFRGSTLFRPMPLNRTCEEAGIPEMYCVCVEGARNIKRDDKIVFASAEVIKNYINNEILEAKSRTWNETIKNHLAFDGDVTNQVDLSSIKKCVKLTVEIEESELVVKPDGRYLLHVTFRTQPNDGLFEGRVIWPDGVHFESGKIHEDIIRINRYGNQADCLPRILMNLLPLIRSLCYCA